VIAQQRTNFRVPEQGAEAQHHYQPQGGVPSDESRPRANYCNKECRTMRKVYAVALPILAVIAFASMSAAAQADEYGICGAKAGEPAKAPCKVNEVFEPFAVAGEGVVGKKVSTAFVLAAGGEEIKCTALAAGGVMWNELTIGHSRIVLRFGKCTVKGATLEMFCTVANPINGNGVIEGVVTDEITHSSPNEVTVMIESGFAVKCGTMSFGNVTGSATGTQAASSAVLDFSAASGLSFAGKAATITGEVEFLTNAGKKVFIS
jgi:hypothetical protein